MNSYKKLLVNLKANIRNILPISIKLFAERLRSIQNYLKWKKDKKFGKNNFINNTKDLKGKFKNKRCIIIGNGPSLNKLDLSLLKDEYTFGLNRIYLLFEKLGFETDFLVSINRFVIEQFAHEMELTKCKKFFHYKYRKYISEKDASFVAQTIYGPNFFSNPDKGFLSYTGSVSFLAIQLALYFGFSEIILVGFDNNFKNSGPSDKAITSKKNDVDHFDKNYFGKGVVWQLPNYNALEYGFKIVEKYFNNNNNEKNIINCTVGGELENFDRKDLSLHLKDSKFGNKKM